MFKCGSEIVQIYVILILGLNVSTIKGKLNRKKKATIDG